MGEIYVSKLAELRKEKALTQRNLADLVGVDPSTVRNWERDRGGIETFVRVAKLCDALGCSPSDLFEVEDLENDQKARLEILEDSLKTVETRPVEIVSFAQAASELKRRGKPTDRTRLKRILVESGGVVPADLSAYGLRVSIDRFNQGAGKWVYFVEVEGDRQ